MFSGVTGRSVKLQSNYFPLASVTDWVVFMYRVDYAPDIDHIGVKKALLRVHKDKFGGYAFDGSVLFCMQRFATDVSTSECI